MLVREASKRRVEVVPVELPFTVVGRSLLQNAVADAMLDEKGTPCVSVPTRLGLRLEEFTPSPTPPPLSPNDSDCRQPPSTAKLGKRTMVTVLTRISSSTNLDERRAESSRPQAHNEGGRAVVSGMVATMVAESDDRPEIRGGGG
eukprot:jgi/Undpi1/1584/HiC_scaffold_11.g04974.m1